MIMKKFLKKTIILLAILSILTSLLTSCGSDYDITATYSKNEESYKYSFVETDESQKLSLSNDAKENLQGYIKNTTFEYKYADVLDTATLYERFMREPQDVTTHSDKALSPSTNLTTDVLMPIVVANNEEYLKTVEDVSAAYEEIPEDDLRAVTDIVVGTINDLLSDNPDVDKARVYCVLGNLTILYKTFDMDFASVDEDGHLFISKGMYHTVSSLTNENANKDILIHECIHLVEKGCQCEEIQNCTMRAGLSKSYDDYDNLAFFRWFMEGSTERIMCNLTNDEPTTYKAYVNYVCSLDMSTICNSEISSNYFENLNFYSNPEMLFKGFNCSSTEDKYEILNMMASIEIMQQLNDDALEKLSEKYGVDFEDSDAAYDFLFTFKPDICMTFAKQFYYNLAELISEGNVTENDACFLIKLFETTMDHHIGFSSDDANDSTKEFLERYKPLREEFFKAIDEENGIDIAMLYENYSAVSASDSTTLNASMNCLTSEKQNFLRERTEYYFDEIESKVK